MTEPQVPELSSGLSAYRPISRANSLEVSLPGSMAYQTRQALLRLRQDISSPDLYVAQKLHYPLKSSVFEFFSDIYRDLYDIGSVDLVPLILNSDSNATLQISLDSETIVKVHEWRRNRKFLPKSMGELRELIGSKYARPTLTPATGRPPTV